MMETGNFKYMVKVTQIQRTGPTEVKTIFRMRTGEHLPMSDDLRQQSAIFDARFSRCRKLLCFLACRVLGSPEQADDVVENCKITASQNPPTFKSEGAFRSWLARILIDEALAMVRQRKSDVSNIGTSLDNVVNT